MIVCPGCGQQLALDDSVMGRTVRCTGCETTFVASPVYSKPQPRGKAGWSPSKVAALAIVCGVAMIAGLSLFQLTRGKPPATEEPPADERAAVERVEGPGPGPGEVVAVPPTVAEPPTLVPTPKVEPPKPVAEPPKPVEQVAVVVPPTPKPTPPVVAPPPPAGEQVRGDQLWDAFGLNEPAADARFRDRPVVVTLRGAWATDDAGRRYFGGPAVEPASAGDAGLTDRERAWLKAGYPANVRCYWQSDATPPTGDRLRVAGVCRGKRDDASVYGAFVVVLEECRAVP